MAASLTGNATGRMETRQPAATLLGMNENSNKPNPNWRLKAACRGLDTRLFFPEVGVVPKLALATCAGCPVKQECGDEAMTDKRNIQGVWGGMSHRERTSAEYRNRVAAGRRNTQQ